MEIYITDIYGLSDAAVFQERYRLLPAQRQAQVRRLRREADRKRSVAAGLLLEYGLRKRGYTLCEETVGYRHIRLAEGPYGKPLAADVPELFFNLSHSGAYAAAVFAETEVGIDIEGIGSAKLELARRFFTEEEYRYVKKYAKPEGTDSKTAAVFTGLWTRKESYIKAVGEGMHLPLASFCVLSEATADGAYHFKTWQPLEGYALSVCAKACVTAEPVYISLQDMVFKKSI